jgi:membrane fusion protein (multidrug efflux system)
MSSPGQRQSVLIASFTLSALLAGAVAGGLLARWGARQQMQDVKFLEAQLKRLNPEGDKPGATQPALVRVATARRKKVQPETSIIGRLAEVSKATVASEVTGKIVKMPVEEGTAVVGGQTLLAQVDDVWSRLALDRLRAQVASIDAKLKYESLELARYRGLGSRRAVSQSEIDLKAATVAELNANLAEAQAAVKEEDQRLVRSAILAPFDGTVVAKYAELGQHVAPGTPIVDIVSRGRIDARLNVPESVVNRIQIDQVLPIRIDPLGDDAPGTVVSVTPFGPAASRTFPVRVRMDDQGGRLKVGMSVTAIIPTGPEEEALVVSKDAVLVRPDGSTVWVAVGGPAAQSPKVQPVPVTISIRLQDEYAVEPETKRGRELLADGASVVIEGAERLTPDQQVRIITLEAAAAEVAGKTSASAATAPPAAPAEGAATAGRQEG